VQKKEKEEEEKKKKEGKEKKPKKRLFLLLFLELFTARMKINPSSLVHEAINEKGSQARYGQKKKQAKST